MFHIAVSFKRPPGALMDELLRAFPRQRALTPEKLTEKIMTLVDLRRFLVNERRALAQLLDNREGPIKPGAFKYAQVDGWQRNRHFQECSLVLFELCINLFGKKPIN